VSANVAALPATRACARAITFSSRGFVFVMPIVSEESLDTNARLRIVSRGQIGYPVSRSAQRFMPLRLPARRCTPSRFFCLDVFSTLNLIARTLIGRRLGGFSSSPLMEQTAAKNSDGSRFFARVGLLRFRFCHADRAGGIS
jgi:hypothetical protein